MTDEKLIQLLRLGEWGGAADEKMVLAADRLEQLGKERNTWQKEALRQNGLMHNAMLGAATAEAKLNKAAEALRELSTCVDDGCYCSEMQMATAMDKARAVLAELETPK